MHDRPSAAAIGRRAGKTRALAQVLRRVAGQAWRRRGFAESRILTDWPAIVGPRLADHCSPERLTFARGAAGGATLWLRVEGALATELQHLEPELLERINGYVGYALVSRLRLIHGPIARGAVRRDRSRRPLSAAEEERLRRLLAEVPSPRLRAALARLGHAVIAEKPGPPAADAGATRAAKADMD